jgi:hypothetical protein
MTTGVAPLWHRQYCPSHATGLERVRMALADDPALSRPTIYLTQIPQPIFPQGGKLISQVREKPRRSQHSVAIADGLRTLQS